MLRNAPRSRGLATVATSVLTVAILLFITACSSSDAPSSSATTSAGAQAATVDRNQPSADPALASELERVVGDAMETHDLRAIIVRVTRDGQEIYTGAMGESMTGVPATPDMHWRNGAFGFTYTGEIVAQLVDQGRISLEDKLSTWMPELPNAENVLIQNLLQMTSGYADYVYTDAVLDGTNADPFRQWTSDELIQIGMSQPIEFDPGTNWGYSHTNYVILGKVLEQLLGESMIEIMDDYIIEPMGLTNTSSNDDTPAIPEPVLHAFTSERREHLQVPAGTPFYEESTFWNPSWTTGEGTVQTTDIYDVTSSMEIVGSGQLVSPEMHELQTGYTLVDFGARDPSGRCSVCNTLTAQRSYGLGVILLGPWITQSKSFAGSGATSGYLPSDKLTISVVTTSLPQAFDPETGGLDNASSAIFNALAAVAAPSSPAGAT